MAADDRLDPARLHDLAPVVDSRAREVFPDLVRVVVLENHDPLAPGDRPVDLATEPFDLLGRDPHGPRLLRVEPHESKSVQGHRAKRLADVTAEARWHLGHS